MPVPDPSSGRAFIWLIACVLFLSVMAGGGCLAAYMLLPESETSSWLPIVGVSLVCLPWAFWTFTFFYRIFSRACGCRIRVGGGVANGPGGSARGGGGGGGSNASGNGDVEEAGVVDQANGERETAVGEQDDRRRLNRALSVASHESEMPLANSMAS